MKVAKLSMPFAQACQLDNEQKNNFLQLQASRLCIQKWEVEALKSLCASKDKGSLDKGLAILYEFAGAIDEIKIVLEGISNQSDLILGVCSLVGEDRVDQMQILGELSKLSALLIKLVHILSNWRKLQACPRPIFFEYENIKMTLSAFLRVQAGKYLELARRLSFNMFSALPLEQVAVLVAVELELSEFVNVYKIYQQGQGRGGGDREGGSAPAPFDASSMEPGSPFQIFYTCWRDVVKLERRIESTWTSFHRVLSPGRTRGGGTIAGGEEERTERSDPYDTFPVLRLPYKNLSNVPTTPDLDWFRSANTLESYRYMAQLLSSHFKQGTFFFEKTRQQQLGEAVGESGEGAEGAATATAIKEMQAMSVAKLPVEMTLALPPTFARAISDNNSPSKQASTTKKQKQRPQKASSSRAGSKSPSSKSLLALNPVSLEQNKESSKEITLIDMSSTAPLPSNIEGREGAATTEVKKIRGASPAGMRMPISAAAAAAKYNNNKDSNGNDNNNNIIKNNKLLSHSASGPSMTTTPGGSNIRKEDSEERSLPLLASRGYKNSIIAAATASSGPPSSSAAINVSDEQPQSIVNSADLATILGALTGSAAGGTLTITLPARNGNGGPSGDVLIQADVRPSSAVTTSSSVNTAAHSPQPYSPKSALATSKPRRPSTASLSASNVAGGGSSRPASGLSATSPAQLFTKHVPADAAVTPADKEDSDTDSDNESQGNSPVTISVENSPKDRQQWVPAASSNNDRSMSVSNANSGPSLGPDPVMRKRSVTIALTPESRRSSMDMVQAAQKRRNTVHGAEKDAAASRLLLEQQQKEQQQSQQLRNKRNSLRGGEGGGGEGGKVGGQQDKRGRSSTLSSAGTGTSDEFIGEDNADSDFGDSEFGGEGSAAALKPRGEETDALTSLPFSNQTPVRTNSGGGGGKQQKPRRDTPMVKNASGPPASRSAMCMPAQDTIVEDVETHTPMPQPVSPKARLLREDTGVVSVSAMARGDSYRGVASIVPTPTASSARDREDLFGSYDDDDDIMSGSLSNDRNNVHRVGSYDRYAGSPMAAAAARDRSLSAGGAGLTSQRGRSRVQSADAVLSQRQSRNMYSSPQLAGRKGAISRDNSSSTFGGGYLETGAYLSPQYVALTARQDMEVERRRAYSSSSNVSGGVSPVSKPKRNPLVESQILKAALGDVKKRGGHRQHVAASTIGVWLKLMYPRRKLIRHLGVLHTCQDIVHLLVETSLSVATSSERKRRALMRQGAAVKIQHTFRRYIAYSKQLEKEQEMRERVRKAWVRLDYWSLSVRSAIRIWRYMKYWRRKFYSRAPAVVSAPRDPRDSIAALSKEYRTSVPLRTVIDKYQHQFALQKKLESHKYIVEKLGASSFNANYDSKRARFNKERERAAVKIQAYVRRHQVKAVVRSMRRFNLMGAKITLFFIFAVSRRRFRRRVHRDKAATIIQKYMRGKLTRMHIYALVCAGLKLNAMWRKHVAHKSLKAQLRRVDRPHTVVVRRLSNLSLKHISGECVRFKLSVWWNPLLHIVSKSDFNVIIETKNPQFIYMSGLYKVKEEIDDGEGAVADSSSEKDCSGGKNSLRESSKDQSRSRALSAVSERSEGGEASDFTPPAGKYQPAASKSSIVAGGVERPVGGVERPSTISLQEEATDTVSQLPRIDVLTPKNANKNSTSSNRNDGSGGDNSDSNALAPIASTHTQATTTTTTDEKRKNSIVKPSAMLSSGPSISDSDSQSEMSSIQSSQGGMSSNSQPVQVVMTIQQQQQQQHPQASLPLVSSTNVGSSSSSNGKHAPRSVSTIVLHGSTDTDNNSQVVASSAKQSTDVDRNKSFLLSRFGESLEFAKKLQQKSLNAGNLDQLQREQQAAAALTAENNSGNGDDSPNNPNNSSGDSNGFKRMNKASLAVMRGVVSKGLSIGHNLASRASVGKAGLGRSSAKTYCDFDETVKIPGCHGNSVLKFDIFDENSRRVGSCIFFLSPEGDMMYWGGEYKKEVPLVLQKRAVNLNGNTLMNKKKASTPKALAAGFKEANPWLDFRIIAGAPLRSKSQWGRVLFKGNGPLTRKASGRDILGTYLFDRWHRLYFSLDEFGLFLFETKFSTQEAYMVPTIDFSSVALATGKPIKHMGKTEAGDVMNVILNTHHGDELHFRFQDSGSRVHWHDVLSNVLVFNDHKDHRQRKNTKKKAPASKASSSGAATPAPLVNRPSLLLVREHLSQSSDDGSVASSNCLPSPSPVKSSGKRTPNADFASSPQKSNKKGDSSR